MAELRITTKNDAHLKQDREKETKIRIVEALVAEIKACELSVSGTQTSEHKSQPDDNLLEKKEYLANLKRRLTAIAPDHALANPIVAIYASREVNDAREHSHFVPFVSFTAKEEANGRRKVQSAKTTKRDVFYYKTSPSKRPQSATAFNRIKLRLPNTASHSSKLAKHKHRPQSSPLRRVRSNGYNKKVNSFMPSQVHNGDVDTTKSLNYGTSRRHQPKRNAFGGKNGSSDNIESMIPPSIIRTIKSNHDDKIGNIAQQIIFDLQAKKKIIDEKMSKSNNTNANSRVGSKYSKVLINALSTALHEFANAHENKQVASLMRLLDSFHMKLHSDTLFLLMTEKRRLKIKFSRFQICIQNHHIMQHVLLTGKRSEIRFELCS